MKTFHSGLSGLVAAVLLTGMAVAQTSIRPVPDCGRPEYLDSTLFIVNSCGLTVSVVYTSLGEVWGGTMIAAGRGDRTAYSREAVNNAGGVSVYTCPGNGTPVQPDGTPIMAHYTGREYGCHGSAMDEVGASGLGRTVQPQLIPQPQIQQTVTNPAPSVPSNTIVIIPVQQPDNTQQASDDDDQNTDADQDNGALMQQYQQNLQNMINMMPNNAVPRVVPAPGHSTARCPGRCQ